MGNSFFDFMKKPVMCKCGHPNKPCHRTGKWYDYSRSCNECECNYFVKRSESETINKGLDIAVMCGFGFICVLVLSFGVWAYGTIHTTPDLDKQIVTISMAQVLNYVGLGCTLFGIWMGGMVFDQITLYFRVHRKEVKPIDPKWDTSNES
jgi:hypothetical protein